MNPVLRQGSDKTLQRLVEVSGVFRFQGDLDFVLRQVEDRVGAEHQLGKFHQQIVEQGGDDAFAIADINVFEKIGRVAKPFFNGVKALLEDLRNSGKNVDVADVDHRREQRLGGEEVGTLGNVRHAQPRLVYLRPQPLAHAPLDIGMADHRD